MSTVEKVGTPDLVSDIGTNLPSTTSRFGRMLRPSMVAGVGLLGVLLLVGKERRDFAAMGVSHPAATRKKVIDLLKQGHTAYEVHKKEGIPTRTIKSWKKRAIEEGIIFPRMRASGTDAKEWWQQGGCAKSDTLYAQGKTLVEAANLFEQESGVIYAGTFPYSRVRHFKKNYRDYCGKEEPWGYAYGRQGYIRPKITATDCDVIEDAWTELIDAYRQFDYMTSRSNKVAQLASQYGFTNGSSFQRAYKGKCGKTLVPIQKAVPSVERLKYLFFKNAKDTPLAQYWENREDARRFSRTVNETKDLSTYTFYNEVIGPQKLSQYTGIHGPTLYQLLEYARQDREERSLQAKTPTFVHLWKDVSAEEVVENLEAVARQEGIVSSIGQIPVLPTLTWMKTQGYSPLNKLVKKYFGGYRGMFTSEEGRKLGIVTLDLQKGQIIPQKFVIPQYASFVFEPTTVKIGGKSREMVVPYFTLMTINPHTKQVEAWDSMAEVRFAQFLQENGIEYKGEKDTPYSYADITGDAKDQRKFDFYLPPPYNAVVELWTWKPTHKYARKMPPKVKKQFNQYIKNRIRKQKDQKNYQARNLAAGVADRFSFLNIEFDQSRVGAGRHKRQAYLNGVLGRFKRVKT